MSSESLCAFWKDTFHQFEGYCHFNLTRNFLELILSQNLRKILLIPTVSSLVCSCTASNSLTFLSLPHTAGYFCSFF